VVFKECDSSSVDMQSQRRQRTEAQEWCFRLMNDPEYFEKWRYIDTINGYSSIIAEFQKLYEQRPAAQRYARARILSGLKKSKRLGQNSGNSRNTRLELQ
jgi:hypothetical protein